jgi:Na+-driven multidrug efflux pump
MALLPTIGLNMAALTLTGQNNGARQYERIRQTFRLSLKYGLWVVVPGMVLAFAYAPFLIGVFTDNRETIDIGVNFLRISIFIYPAYLILYLGTSVLQGLKKPNYAIWIGIYRQMLLPVIIFPLFVNSIFGSITGVWWGIFLINWSATLITWWYLRYSLKKIGA